MLLKSKTFHNKVWCMVIRRVIFGSRKSVRKVWWRRAGERERVEEREYVKKWREVVKGKDKKEKKVRKRARERDGQGVREA